MLKEKQLLSQYTTLQLGGVADYVAEVTSADELREALTFAQTKTDTAPLILGGGSNVLCSDAGYRGVVVVNRLPGYEAKELDDGVVEVTVGAGEDFDAVVARTVADGYWGLENLSAIPGSVGATPIQNVGAYGVEVASVIQLVTAINIKTLEEKTFTADECQFGYRDSYFKTPAGKAWCVTTVTYRLTTSPAAILTYKDLAPLTDTNPTQADIRQHVITVRSGKFPNWHEVGTAGSFFKNPIISTEHYTKLLAEYPDLPGFAASDTHTKVPLGWILDKACGLKGFQEGAVRLYENQALVLVAEAGATAADVEAFVSKVAAVVKSKTDIEIEREVLSV